MSGYNDICEAGMRVLSAGRQGTDRRCRSRGRVIQSVADWEKNVFLENFKMICQGKTGFLAMH